MFYVVLCLALFGLTMKGQGRIDALYAKGHGFICRNVTSSVEKRDAFLLALEKLHAGGTYVIALLFGFIGVGIPLIDTGGSDFSFAIGMLLGAGVFVLYVRTTKKWATS